MDDNTPLVALTTLEDRSQAVRLVRSLVDQRLVACGTILDGATSVYRWEGQVQESAEAMVVLKTTQSRWHDLSEAIDREHPYDVPELVALPITEGAGPYLSWITAETRTG